MAQQPQKTPEQARTAGTRTAKVHRPTHVPPELLPIWQAAAQRLANNGQLLKKKRVASGGVKEVIDYPTVNDTYKRILKAYLKAAEEAG